MLTIYISIRLCIDIFFVNNFIFLDSILRKLKYITVIQIKGRKYKVVLSILLQIIILYKAREFNVDFVLTGGDFFPMNTKLTEKGILLNDVTINEYVPEIEKLIHIIKERERSKLSTLHFKSSNIQNH